jgi:hypothetical protein
MELTDPWQAQNIQDVTTKVLKHNCFIALILMHPKVTIWLFFYSE